MNRSLGHHTFIGNNRVCSLSRMTQGLEVISRLFWQLWFLTRIIAHCITCALLTVSPAASMSAILSRSVTMPDHQAPSAEP